MSVQIQRRFAAACVALLAAALLVVPAAAAGPAPWPAADEPVPTAIVRHADLLGEACRDVRPEGAADYLAIPGRGGRLDVRIARAFCHEGETLVIVVKGEPVGRISIQAGGRGVAEFDTIHDDHFPRVHTGDRIALVTQSGDLVAGGIFR